MMKRKPNRGSNKRRAGKAGTGRALDLAAAAEWPVFGCLVRKNWRDHGVLSEVLVSKRPPFGGVVSCLFLLDLDCLGPKDGFVTQFSTPDQYERDFRSLMTENIPMVAVDFPLVVKILRDAISYAQKLGFELPQGVDQALRALGSLDAADECREEIPLGGEDGLPHYMAGPDDDVEEIMRILDANCGRGNYNFTVPQGPIPPDF